MRALREVLGSSSQGSIPGRLRHARCAQQLDHLVRAMPTGPLCPPSPHRRQSSHLPRQYIDEGARFIDLKAVQGRVGYFCYKDSFAILASLPFGSAPLQALLEAKWPDALLAMEGCSSVWAAPTAQPK